MEMKTEMVHVKDQIVWQASNGKQGRQPLLWASAHQRISLRSKR